MEGRSVMVSWLVIRKGFLRVCHLKVSKPRAMTWVSLGALRAITFCYKVGEGWLCVQTCLQAKYIWKVRCGGGFPWNDRVPLGLRNWKTTELTDRSEVSPLLAFFPTLVLFPLLCPGSPRNPSLIKHLHQNPILRVCFWVTDNDSQEFSQCIRKALILLKKKLQVTRFPSLKFFCPKREDKCYLKRKVGIEINYISSHCTYV